MYVLKCKTVSDYITVRWMLNILCNIYTLSALEQNPGHLLLFARDEILPSYIGIIISQYKDPYTPTRILTECHTRWAPGASYTWSEKPPHQLPEKIGCAWGDFTLVIGVISPKLYPTGSTYGIFTYIWLISMVNVGKYTIHGSYGYVVFGHTLCCIAPEVRGPNRPRSWWWNTPRNHSATSQEISTNWKMMTEKEKQPLRFPVHEKK